MKLGVKYQMWKHKQADSHLVVVGKYPNGKLKTTFQLDTIDPKRYHTYDQQYLDQYYEYIGPYSWIA